MARLLSKEIRQKIENFLGAGVDIKEFNTISKIYGIIAASEEKITLEILAQKYKLLPLDEVWSIAIVLSNAGVIRIEYKTPISESMLWIVSAEKEARKQARIEKSEISQKERGGALKIKPRGFPVIINKAQMKKAETLLKMPNGISLAKILENLGLQQNPNNIKILLGRLKGRFNPVIAGNPEEDPEKCILKIEP